MTIEYAKLKSGDRGVRVVDDGSEATVMATVGSVVTVTKFDGSTGREKLIAVVELYEDERKRSVTLFAIASGKKPAPRRKRRDDLYLVVVMLGGCPHDVRPFDTRPVAELAATAEAKGLRPDEDDVFLVHVRHDKMVGYERVGPNEPSDEDALRDRSTATGT